MMRCAAVNYARISILIAIGIYVLPWPPPLFGRQLISIVRSSADVALLGTSAIDFVAVCDHDRRNLAVMLADTAGRNVLDLSEGGQALWRSINLAALAGRYGGARDIILPITFDGLDDHSTPPYRDLLAYELLDSGFSVFRSDDLRAFWQGFSNQPNRHTRGFMFEGATYPDYRGISAKWFAREARMAKTCPEQTTVDPVFTRAYYWWLYVAQRTHPDLIDMVGELKTNLSAHNRRLHVVLMPTNFDLIEHPGQDPCVVIMRMPSNSSTIKVLTCSICLNC
jgi:hypothetical protein